jgi:hypothetical protein
MIGEKNIVSKILTKGISLFTSGSLKGIFAL